MGEYDKGYSWHSYGVWLRITHQRSSIQGTSYPPIPKHHQSRCFSRLNKIAKFKPGKTLAGLKFRPLDNTYVYKKNNWYDSCRMTKCNNGSTYLDFWSISLSITFSGDFSIFKEFRVFSQNLIFFVYFF